MTTEDSNTDLFSYTKPVKILLPAYVIPLGSTVTKPTGSKEYTLADDIKVFQEEHPNKTIKFGTGVRILVNNSSINVIDDHSILGWITTFDKLNDIMEMEKETL